MPNGGGGMAAWCNQARFIKKKAMLVSVAFFITFKSQANTYGNSQNL